MRSARARPPAALAAARGSAACAALGLAALLNPVPARAHVVSDRDLQVVARLPAAAIRGLALQAPDSGGFVRPNRPGAWRGVGFQRGALLLLVDAAARADTTRAERCWQALELAFAHQLPEGGFRGPAPAAGAGDPGAGAELDDEPAWLAAACRALIAVMNSPLQDRFRFRYALLKPKLQRSVDAFERRSEAFRLRHADRPALLLTAAAAMLLADGIYHDQRYGRAGQQALVEALALQRKDGLFPSAGRPGAAEHALGLGALQSVAIYFPSPTLERSAERARAWLSRNARSRPAGRPAARPASAAGPAAGRFEPIVIPGEIEFVLRYGAIRPPAPVPATPH
jgi:hypothetical protein